MRASPHTSRSRVRTWSSRVAPAQGSSALSRPIRRLRPPARTKPVAASTELTVPPAWRTPAALELHVRVDDPLQSGHVREHRDRPEGGYHPVADRSDDEQDDPLRALEETHRATRDQALRPRAGVGGHEAAEGRDPDED